MSLKIEQSRRNLKGAITRYANATAEYSWRGGGGQPVDYKYEKARLQRALDRVNRAIDNFTRVCRLEAYTKLPLRAERTAAGVHNQQNPS